MPHRVLQAIRSQPWAIDPTWLGAIESIAERAVGNALVAEIAQDGHQDRYPAALAAMGSRLEGTRKATVRNGVACLPLMGPIFPRASLLTELSGATSLDVLAADLRAIQSMEAVRTVLLVVDSPGGMVTSVHEFAQMIASSTKSVVAHVSGLGCSAAYWIASQAGEIVIDPTGMVGSVGVVTSGSYQETADANGRREVTITSSNAVNKRPDLSTDEGKAVVRATLDAIEATFLSAVAAGRGVSVTTVRTDFGAGGERVGASAVQAGMADRVDTLTATLSRLSDAVIHRPAPRRRAAAASLDLRRRGA
jgi:ClpP class serine protease